MQSLTVALFLVLALATGLIKAEKYTVWVGYEDLQTGLEVNSYFPKVLRIHPGDTVVFKQTSVEIHTVTFHPGEPLPDLLLPNNDLNMRVATPTDMSQPYDGTTYANSGIMAKGSPVDKFTVTFSTVGSFEYACAVHGAIQSGIIKVVRRPVDIPSPQEIRHQWKEQRRFYKKKGHLLYAKALKSVPKPTQNPDSTHTHYVRVGFDKDEYMMVTFFPREVKAHAGDTIEWYGSSFHTVSFLAGRPTPPIITMVRGKLVFNPAIYTPANLTRPITATNYINSGLLVDPNAKFSLKVGHIEGSVDYICIVHADLKMVGKITERDD